MSIGSMAKAEEPTAGKGLKWTEGRMVSNTLKETEDLKPIKGPKRITDRESNRDRKDNHGRITNVLPGSPTRRSKSKQPGIRPRMLFRRRKEKTGSMIST